MNKGNFKTPLKGEHYKDWTVVSDLIKSEDNHYHRKAVKVRCKCGTERIMPITYLYQKNKHIKCHSCANKENNAAKKNNGYMSYGDIGGCYFSNLKWKSIKRGLEFKLSINYLWELFLKQEQKCSLSGIKINLSREMINSDPNYTKITASLDRINPEIGYIEGNVQWVHKLINIVKATLTNNEFIFICNLISNLHKDNPEPSLVNIEFLNKRAIPRKVQRLTSAGSIPNNLDTSAQHPNLDDDIV